MDGILLISAPGAGKGVTSKYISDKYNYVHMSIGNLLRDEAKLNIDVENIISKGGFVSHELVYNLIDEFIVQNQNKNIIFEGFPRMMEQLDLFNKLLTKHNINLSKVIFIDVDKKVAIKRIQGRLICSNCNSIYNKYFDKLDSDKCSKCNSTLVSRSDDKVSTYENRYNAFEEKTIPLVNYYKEKGILYTISNNGDINETYNQLDRLMGRKMV